MNLLKGRFDGATGRSVFKTNDGIVLPLPGSVQGHPVRKRSMASDRNTSPFPGQVPGIPAKIVVVEPLGPEPQVTASVGGQTVVTMFHERISVQPD